MKLKKSLMFTDIHFGRKNNSIQHNDDCLKFIDWLYDIAKNDKSIDHIIFLGDFFQTRSAIDISTIKYANIACNKLNSLNIPVYIIVGNHDLYHKHSREIHSPFMFTEFSNFIIIDTPQHRSEIGNNTFISPYLFKHEYKEIKELNDSEIVFGHFEFNNFYVTGYHKVFHENGPDPDEFSKPKYIFSGHFHKRQISKNIIYIGNTFPFDFSDLDDDEKGCCIYDHEKSKYEFIDWKECPTFRQIKLSDILEKLENKESNIFEDDSSVNCIMDVAITYEQHINLKNYIRKTYKLREFNLKEIPDLKKSIEEESTDLNIDFDDDNIPVLNELVLQMIDKIDVEKIDKKLLKKIYKGIHA